MRRALHNRGIPRKSAVHDLRDALQQITLEQVFEHHGGAVRVGERDAPVRVLVVGARLVLCTLLTNGVHDGRGEQLARRALEAAVQRFDDFGLVRGFVFEQRSV